MFKVRRETFREKAKKRAMLIQESVKKIKELKEIAKTVLMHQNQLQTSTNLDTAQEYALVITDLQNKIINILTKE